jgi:hypothetical protein
MFVEYAANKYNFDGIIILIIPTFNNSFQNDEQEIVELLLF